MKKCSRLTERAMGLLLYMFFLLHSKKQEKVSPLVNDRGVPDCQVHRYFTPKKKQFEMKVNSIKKPKWPATTTWLLTTYVGV